MDQPNDQKPEPAKEPLRTREDVEKQVLANLSDTSNPNNWSNYDLSARRPLKEKMTVIVKGFSYILVFGIIMLIGRYIDENVLGIDYSRDRGRNQIFSLSGFVFIFLIFGIFVIRARRSLRR